MVKSGAKWRKECLKMLMGEFQHNLDAKGRLFMPVKLREACLLYTSDAADEL